MRPKWLFERSLFKEYKADDDAVIKKCFEADWKNGKYLNFIKDETDRQKVKVYLHSVYYLFKDCYRYVSSNTNVENLFGVGSNV